MTIAELRASRAKSFDAYKALANKPDFNDAVDQPELRRLEQEVMDWGQKINRAVRVMEIEMETALPVAGQDVVAHKTFAQAKFDPWTNQAAAEALGLATNKGLIFGGVSKMLGLAKGSYREARLDATEIYGENHPVTKALQAGSGSAGGFLVPPDYVNEIIELLRPASVVRQSNPRSMPMPRGTMILPAQTAAASASYGGEQTQINVSQPSVGAIVATYKKLTAMVPLTNDLMRYSDPAADAFARDDIVKVLALREDLAFLVGDGTQDSPKGFTAFANMWAAQNGGTAGVYLTTANSTAAVGGNFITSTEAYSLQTVAQELGGAVNKLDTANVPDMRRMWFMHPRSWNYLNNVQNSLGLYVYRDELAKGALLGYPFKKSTQIPINIHDATSANNDCSVVMLVEMSDAMLLDSMQLELAVSRDSPYYDSTGTLVSTFQKDQTLIRAIAEHDFQMRHPASISVIQFVRWAPAIS